MELTPKDAELFKSLHESEVGKSLLDYLERLKKQLFNPDTLTKENLEVRQGVSEVLDDHLIDRIKLVNKKKSGNPNSFL